MKGFILLAFIFVISAALPSLTSAEPNVKAGFLREGNLWTLINGEEKQITDSGKVFAKPAWSPDGKWLLYQVEAPSEFEENEKQIELWTYHLETRQTKKVFYDGYSPAWAPTGNLIAFNANGILNISDVNRFFNIASGVNSFTWLPDGSGFLLSSSGVLRPDGWTSAILFIKKAAPPFQTINVFGDAVRFFTLPREIGIDDNKIISINAGNFNFSPSTKWISFTVSPTASWSMDSNMLCVISHDGKDFQVLDEVVFEVGKPKWSPTSDILAYIAGGGRIVFGFKNKDLKVREMPASGSLTPANFADVDFDWITNTSLITSRIEERDWSNDFSQHPLPVLVLIDITKNQQSKLTNPPKGYGDYNPQYVKSIDKLVWLRGKSITDEKRTLWMANADGTGTEAWLKNVEEIVFYEK